MEPSADDSSSLSLVPRDALERDTPVLPDHLFTETEFQRLLSIFSPQTERPRFAERPRNLLRCIGFRAVGRWEGLDRGQGREW